MKIPNPFVITLRIFSASLALVAASATLCGQDSGSAPAPAAPAPPPPAAQPPAGAAVPITPGQQTQLKAAYEQAMQDPKVQASQGASKEVWDSYRDIVKKKIVANDPAMQPLFDKADKVAAARAAGQAVEPLSAEDQKALHDALMKVESDPEIKDAQEKVIDARKATNALVRAAIVKADPTLEPVLEQIDKSRQAAAAGAAGGQ